MNIIDIIFSIVLIVIGAGSAFGSIVRKARRGQSKFVSFVVSILFIVGGILSLVFGFPVSEYVG